MQKKQKIGKQNLFLLFLLVFMSVVSIFAPIVKTLFAEETTDNYTSVIGDLQKSEDFNKLDYHTNEDDKQTVNFITLAKSVKNELFIYTYQPNPKEYYATSINLSYEFLSKDSFDSFQEVEHLQSSKETNYQNYELTFLNHDSVFYKYKVKNFTFEENKEISTHYIDITSIFRSYNKYLDHDIETYGGTISEVPFTVGKKIAMTYVNDKLEKMSSQEIELIKISDKYTGYVRYENGHGGFWSTTYNNGYDSHFIAFNTDNQINKLLSAEIIYSKQHFTDTREGFWNGCFNSNPEFGEIERNIKVTIDYDQIFDLSVKDGTHYKRRLIQTGKEFVESEYSHTIQQHLLFNQETTMDLTEQSKQDIGNKQWVLRFAETEYVYDKNYNWNIGTGILTALVPWTIFVNPQKTNIAYDIVLDVSVLKLTYAFGEDILDLGVIDNKSTPSVEPSNGTIVDYTAPTWLQKIGEFFKNNKMLIIILVVLLLVILAPFVPFIAKMFELIFKAIILLFKGIWYVITLPIKLIKK